MTLIAESGTYKVFYEDRGGDLLVLSYSHMDFPSDRDFWGQQVFEKIGVSVMGITAKANHWYPTSLRDMPEALVPIHRHRFRVGYGFSMGAYGAIKFSGLFKTDVVLALSPQLSIDPADGDGRFSNFFPPPNDGGRALSSSDMGGRIMVAYDPAFQPDAIIANQIASKWGDTTRVLVPWVGHFTHEAVAGSKKLEMTLAALRSGSAQRVQAVACFTNYGTVIPVIRGQRCPRFSETTVPFFRNTQAVLSSSL